LTLKLFPNLCSFPNYFQLANQCRAEAIVA
jgi:hypothetical protein